MHPHPKTKQYVSLPLRQGHFRVVRIPFISEFCISFNYVIETTKCIPTITPCMADMCKYNHRTYALAIY